MLSLLDKPLSLLGKVNGILKPEDKKGRGEDEAFASSDKGETEGGVEVAMERCVRYHSDQFVGCVVPVWPCR